MGVVPPNATVKVTFHFNKDARVSDGEQIVVPFKATGDLKAALEGLPSELKNAAGQVLFTVSKNSAGDIVLTATSLTTSLNNLQAEMTATVAFTNPHPASSTSGTSSQSQSFGFQIGNASSGVYTLQPVTTSNQSNTSVVDNSMQMCDNGLETSFGDGVDWSAIQNAILASKSSTVSVNGVTPDTDFYVITTLTSPHATTFTVGNIENLDTLYSVGSLPQFTNNAQYVTSMATNTHGSFTTSSTPLTVSDAEQKATNLTAGQWTGTTGTESNGDSYASVVMNLGSVAHPSNIAPVQDQYINKTSTKVNGTTVTLPDVLKDMRATVPGVQAESIVTDNITATLTDSAYKNTITNMTANSLIVYKNANGQWIELDPGQNNKTSVPTCPATWTGSGSASGIDTPPVGSTQTVHIGATINAENAVGNSSSMPAGSTYTWKSVPDTSTPGEKKAVVQVTYPDNSTATASVTVNVIPDAIAQTVNVGTTAIPENSLHGLSSMPAGTTYSWQSSPDTSTPGVKKANVIVTYPDKSTATVPVTVNVVPAAQTQTVPLNSTVSPEKSLKDLESMPAGSTYTWKSAPDTSTPGEKKAVVQVTFPDETTADVPVTVNVTSDAETHKAEGTTQNNNNNNETNVSVPQTATTKKTDSQKKITVTESSALAKTGASVIAVVVAMLAFFGVGMLLKKRHRKDDSSEE